MKITRPFIEPESSWNNSQSALHGKMVPCLFFKRNHFLLKREEADWGNVSSHLTGQVASPTTIPLARQSLLLNCRISQVSEEYKLSTLHFAANRRQAGITFNLKQEFRSERVSVVRDFNYGSQLSKQVSSGISRKNVKVKVSMTRLFEELFHTYHFQTFSN